MKSIYLAGTIYGVNENDTEDDKNWKTRFQSELGYPKPRVSDLGKTRCGGDGIYQFLDPIPEMETQHFMVPTDKKMIKRCDVFVAYIQRASVGTSMEVYFASQLEDTPVIIINPNNKFKDDLWLSYHADVICDNVEICAKYIESMNK